MVADRILVLGFDNPARPSLKTSLDQDKAVPQVTALLTKLGYEALIIPEGQSLVSFLNSQLIDGILIDSEFAPGTLGDLLDFFRANESTRTTPVVAAVDRPRELQNLKEKKFPRVELLLKPVPVGILASRLATNLRVRKLDGADSSRASLGDMNASLRDVNQRFAQEREEAKRIQLALLPQSLPVSDKYDLAVAYKPLEDVGGDWYYYTETKDSKISFQVADITGHGISAAFIGSMTKLALMAIDCSQPARLLTGMNKLMVPVLPEGRFVTMGSFEYDPASGILQASYAGHPPAIIVRAATRDVQELKGAGFPLGFEADFEYQNKEMELSSGDIVLAYTDGISEALNLANQMFGVARIGESLLSADSSCSAQQLLDRLLKDLDSFREGRIIKDDVTVMVLKVK